MFHFKFYYPSIMAERMFLFPTKKGSFKTIEEIPDQFQYGIYNIEVISTDTNFNKIFAPRGYLR